ncbi:unnamed protein product, partial [Discosporangium mesarthrocarpum]
GGASHEDAAPVSSVRGGARENWDGAADGTTAWLHQVWFKGRGEWGRRRRGSRRWARFYDRQGKFFDALGRYLVAEDRHIISTFTSFSALHSFCLQGVPSQPHQVPFPSPLSRGSSRPVGGPAAAAATATPRGLFPRGVGKGRRVGQGEGSEDDGILRMEVQCSLRQLLVHADQKRLPLNMFHRTSWEEGPLTPTPTTAAPATPPQSRRMSQTQPMPPQQMPYSGIMGLHER